MPKLIQPTDPETYYSRVKKPKLALVGPRSILTCSRCAETKPRESFAIAPPLGGRGNHRWTECKACHDDPKCITCSQRKSEGAIFFTKRNGNASSECKPCVKARNQRYAQEMKRDRPAMWMFTVVRQRAQTEGIPFAITPDDIFIPTHCPVLGIKLKPPGSGLQEDSPTLDRRIPELGYVRGNIEVISGRANRIKDNATVDELQSLLNWLRSRGI